MSEKKKKDTRKDIVKDRSSNKKNPNLSWSGYKIEPGDNSRYVAQAYKKWNLPKIDTSDPKQVEERMQWYIKDCFDNDTKPTVSGMCNSLGITRQTFYNWGVGDRRGREHVDPVLKARALMEEIWETYMVEGKIHYISGMFLGKNHFGYTDKKEVVVEPRHTVVEPEDVDDVIKLYESNDK